MNTFHVGMGKIKMNIGELKGKHRGNSKAVMEGQPSDNKTRSFRLANVYILSLFFFVCLFLEAARIAWRSTGQECGV